MQPFWKQKWLVGFARNLANKPAIFTDLTKRMEQNTIGAIETFCESAGQLCIGKCTITRQRILPISARRANAVFHVDMCDAVPDPHPSKERILSTFSPGAVSVPQERRGGPGIAAKN